MNNNQTPLALPQFKGSVSVTPLDSVYSTVSLIRRMTLNSTYILTLSIHTGTIYVTSKTSLRAGSVFAEYFAQTLPAKSPQNSTWQIL